MEEGSFEYSACFSSSTSVAIFPLPHTNTKPKLVTLKRFVEVYIITRDIHRCNQIKLLFSSRSQNHYPFSGKAKHFTPKPSTIWFPLLPHNEIALIMVTSGLCVAKPSEHISNHFFLLEFSV